MKKWTIFAFMLLGCGTQSGEASKPDDGDLRTFDEFSRWGMGMAAFTAPPSNQVAGGGGSGSGGNDDAGEDRNCRMTVRLVGGTRYGVDVRLFGTGGTGAYRLRLTPP